MSAGLEGKEETLVKRCDTSERFGSFGRRSGGLRDLNIPSDPNPTPLHSPGPCKWSSCCSTLRFRDRPFMLR